MPKKTEVPNDSTIFTRRQVLSSDAAHAVASVTEHR